MFNHTFFRPWAVLILALGLVSCAEKNPKSPKFVVAEGKNVHVTRGDLDREEATFLKQRGATLDQVPADRLAQLDQSLLERLVISQLLEQEAKSLPLPGFDDKVKAELDRVKKMFPDETTYQSEMTKAGMTEDLIKENIRRQLLFREIIDQKVPEGLEPTDQAIATFYKDNPKNFAQPEMVKASHILIKVPADASADVKAQRRKVAEAARLRVTKGEPFSQVARELSEDPGSGPQGGDLGYFQRGEMVPEFDKVAFSTKVGAVSPIFETPYGFHFLTVTGTKEAKTIPIEEAKPKISSYLRDKDRSTRVDDYLKTLKDNAKVVYKLPPPPVAPTAPVSTPPATK